MSTDTSRGRAQHPRDELPSGRVGALRAAKAAEVDPGRLRAATVALCMAGLAVASALLFAGGAHRNAQVAALHDDGVVVTVTSTGCTGLLGGSGSNPVGYRCRGAFTLHGRRVVATLPGTMLRPPGTAVTAVVDPQDPGLLTTVAAARADRPTPRVYALPSVLAAALVALVAVVLTRRRRPGRRVTSGAAVATT